MSKFKFGLSLLCVVQLLSSGAMAGPSFTNITDSDFEKIAKEMSANFTHSSLMGASKLGTLFGFQVGIIGAQTSSSDTNTIVKRNAGAELPNLYNAGLLAAVGLPFGISGEAVIIPTTSASGASISSTSFGLKMNFNEFIPVLPVNLALRGIYSSAKFSFSQTISSANATVENKTNVSGLQLLVSPMLPFVEPYVGVGVLNGSNDLSVSGTASSIFDPSYTSSQSASKSVSSIQYLAGIEVNLLLLKLGAEYSQSFGTNRIGAKLSFGF